LQWPVVHVDELWGAVRTIDVIRPYQLLKFTCSSRRIRRAAHEALTKRVLHSYRPIETKEATILVSSLLASSASTQPEKHFQRFTTSTIMSIVYDHPTIVSEHDPTIEKINDYIDRFGRAAALGSNLVDIFPWMMYIPDRYETVCIPCILTDNLSRFAKWKRDGKRQFHQDYAMFSGLLNRVRVDLVCTFFF